LPPYSLYFHYPFCIKRCPYCGFATAVEKEDLAVRYREALLVELKRRLDEEPWKNNEIKTVYFGGGTPSLMPPEYIATLLAILNSKFQIPNLEITLEANPETRDVKAFEGFRKAGVNRLSMGAQSFNPEELKVLGRAHSAGGVFEAVKMARAAGFDNISLDLIYGVPGQSVESFQRSVETCISLDVEHISTYTLSIEEGTPFQRSIKEKRFPYPDPDLMADQYAVLIDLMRQAGFEHYELTNYAKPGYHSRHNSAYWDRSSYLGIGNGAHSFDGRRRFWNRRDTRAHITEVMAGRDPTEGEEILTSAQILEEEVYLRLRAKAGLTEDLIARECNAASFRSLVSGGFLVREGEVWIVAEEKWLMLDEVVIRLMEK